jgi:hypothetical protein
MKLYVDDIRVEREEVEVHYQRDPFPGGHRFTLTIPEPDVAAELGFGIRRNTAGGEFGNNRAVSAPLPPSVLSTEGHGAGTEILAQ